MAVRGVFWAAAYGAALVATMPVGAAENPKRDGTLTYVIPADALPNFDGHRETTYATIHSVAPYYSVLIRINPDNPGPPLPRCGRGKLAAVPSLSRTAGRLARAG